MNKRLVQRLVVIVLVMASAALIWRLGIDLGWWADKACHDSREVKRDSSGKVIAIQSRTCVQK